MAGLRPGRNYSSQTRVLTVLVLSIKNRQNLLTSPCSVIETELAMYAVSSSILETGCWLAQRARFLTLSPLLYAREMAEEAKGLYLLSPSASSLSSVVAICVVAIRVAVGRRPPPSATWTRRPNCRQHPPSIHRSYHRPVGKVPRVHLNPRSQ